MFYLRQVAVWGRERRNFLVKAGMQSIPHNATPLQLLQSLVQSQDNERTACGVEKESGSAPIFLLCAVGPQQSTQQLCFSGIYTEACCVQNECNSICCLDQWVSKHHNPVKPCLTLQWVLQDELRSCWETEKYCAWMCFMLIMRTCGSACGHEHVKLIVSWISIALHADW